MKTKKLIILLSTLLLLTACEQEESGPLVPHIIEYVVSRHDIPNISTTVEVRTQNEYDALLDSLCDYTLQGKFVTFHSNKKNVHPTKEATIFSTSDREEMKRWMAQMEDAGKTVTVTYDSRTHTWNGVAYINTTDNTLSQYRRLSRVTMDYVVSPGHYEEHHVFTYFWDGNRLNNVDMVKERFNHFMQNGIMVDSIFYTHHTATLTYSDSIRIAAYFFDAEGMLFENIQYSYQDGQLIQEHQNIHTYTYFYNSEGYIDHWNITPEYNLALPADIQCEWENGDMVRTDIDCFEYDNSPHPYGVTLGTTTLMPGHVQPSDYLGYIPPETQWSRHNLTHYFELSKGHGTELRIIYTYDSEGYPITAECNWFDSGTIRWTYEYND